MIAASPAVRKVRLQRLSLAGFGCYRCATHFELGGGSRIFVAGNECGKSTFLRGLLYTLFGVPGGKKRQLFLRRYYNWDRPDEFWGRVEFECNGEQWSVVRDFRRDTVTVTAHGPAGDRIVLNRHRHRERASETRKDPYDDLLDTWFGIRTRSIYEGIFCIDQRSTVLQRSQIDERVWRYVYGEAAAALERERRRIYERFRRLTACTRDYGVTLASGAGRNGRTPGRIEQLKEDLQRARQRYDQIQAELVHASDREGSDVEDLERQLDHVRSRLSTWERWVSIQERLLEAVQARSGAVRSLDADPADQPEGTAVQVLRRVAAEGISVEELRARLGGLAERRRLSEEVERLDQQIRELEQQLAALRRDQQAAGDPAALEATLHDLLRLKAIVSELDRLEQVRAELAPADADGCLNDEQAHLLQELLAVADQAVGVERRYRDLRGELQRACEERERLNAELTRLQTARAQAGELLQKHQQEAEDQHQQACRLREQLAALEQEHNERFRVLEGAPPGLPMLWDRLHALRQQLEQVDRALQQRDLADRLRHSRTRWRRLLLALGLTATLFSVLLATGWLDLLLAGLCGGLTALVRRVFPTPPSGSGAEAEDLRSRRRKLETEIRAILSMLGTRFAPDPSLELQVRRLWPEYERSLAKLEELRRELRGVESAEQAAVSERDRVMSDLCETIDSLEREIETQQARLRELDDCQARLEQEIQATAERFGEILQGLGIERVQPDQLSSAPIPDRFRFVTEKLVFDARSATLGDLLQWVADNGERVREALAERREHAEAVTRQWGAEVWWSLQNVGLGADDSSETEHPPAGFDAEGAIARLRAEADDLRARLNPLDESADPEELKKRLEDAKALASLVQEAEARIRELAAQRDGLQERLQSLGESSPELSPLLDRFDGDVDRVVHEFRRMTEGACSDGESDEEVAELRRQARELMTQFPELVAALEQPPDYATHRVQELRAQVERLESTVDERRRQAEERRAALAERRRELEELTARIAELEEELRGLEHERDELAAQFRDVSERLESLRKDCRAQLEARISVLFASFSRRPDRRVVLDESLHVMIRDPDNHTYVPAHLSHGARDQLCLAVYLALADNLDLPFVFDDPFVNCDEERLAAIRAVWEKLSASRQLILLSHSPQFEGWAEPIEIHCDAQQTPQRVAA